MTRTFPTLPGEGVSFTENGHTIRVTATHHEGFHTGRRRYMVECTTCEELLHSQTTGPEAWHRDHVREPAGRRDNVVQFRLNGNIDACRRYVRSMLDRDGDGVSGITFHVASSFSPEEERGFVGDDELAKLASDAHYDKMCGEFGRQDAGTFSQIAKELLARRAGRG